MSTLVHFPSHRDLVVGGHRSIIGYDQIVEFATEAGGLGGEWDRSTAADRRTGQQVEVAAHGPGPIAVARALLKRQHRILHEPEPVGPDRNPVGTLFTVAPQPDDLRIVAIDLIRIGEDDPRPLIQQRLEQQVRLIVPARQQPRIGLRPIVAGKQEAVDEDAVIERQRPQIGQRAIDRHFGEGAGLALVAEVYRLERRDIGVGEIGHGRGVIDFVQVAQVADGRIVIVDPHDPAQSPRWRRTTGKLSASEKAGKPS